MNKFKNFFLSLLAPGSAIPPEEDTRQFITAAFNDMIEHNRTHAASWRYGKEMGWTADLDAGVIVFKFAGDRTATCHFQSIGVYDEITGQFTWAWAQKLRKNQQIHARQARNWGRFHRHPHFLSATISCTMDEAWNLAAVTRMVSESKNVYRGRVGNKYLFMTTDDLQIDTKGAIADWTKARHTKTW